MSRVFVGFVLGVILGGAGLQFASAQREVADFAVVVEPAEDGATLSCVRGCAWLELSFSCDGETECRAQSTSSLSAASNLLLRGREAFPPPQESDRFDLLALREPSNIGCNGRGPSFPAAVSLISMRPGRRLAGPKTKATPARSGC